MNATNAILDPTLGRDSFSRIIWSADVNDVPTLEAELSRMPNLRVIKIDRWFVDQNGWGVFDLLRDRGLLVFADAKIIEIPTKLAKIARTYCEKARPWMLNCMSGAVSTEKFESNTETTDGLRRFADVCAEFDVLSCAVTVLTSKSTVVARDEFGGRDAKDQVLWYVEHMVKAGFTDLVCSPLEIPALLERGFLDHINANTPGVRPSGSDVRDQARTNTPAGAILSGASRLVIGGPITNGPGTPTENLAPIAREIAPYVNVRLEES